MYQVPGTDIVFACIMCALMMILAYVIGRIYGKKQNQVTHDGMETAYMGLWKDFCVLEEVHDATVEDHRRELRHMLQEQGRALNKKHRLALAKHKAKCDARLSTQFELMRDTIATHKANHAMAMSRHEAPDFSRLLSK